MFGSVCPLGLSPKDEFFLWGLLAMTLADPESDGEFHATRHYCLRRLGLIDAKARRGGRQYRDFTAAIERLACVRYQCDKFYDPIRAEHRRVVFGFFSYSLPLDDESSRAWRFAWDPIFFEFVRAAGGALRFNLKVYRQLDVASRRLYLFLTKLFFRQSVTSRLDVNEVAEQILGVAPSVSLRDKKAKLQRCIDQLTRHDVIQTRRDHPSRQRQVHDGVSPRLVIPATGHGTRVRVTAARIAVDHRVRRGRGGPNLAAIQAPNRAGMGRYHPGRSRTVWAALLQTGGPGILDG